jgi:hypothetical protein
VDVGSGVVKVVESAMVVVRETVDLFASCCPRLEYACGVASANGVELKSGVLYGGSDGTADECVTASGLLGYAKCGDGHACVVAGQSGVWVDGNVVEDFEERLLVHDQGLDVGHKICSCSMKCSRCCVINDTSQGENKTSSLCVERNALCAWTEKFASARICRQCCVCSSALAEEVLSSGIRGRAMVGTRGEPEVCARSTGSATLSAK